MLETGLEVKESGIYRVYHREHRLAHEVTLVAGQRFPRCGRCRGAVKFELVKSAPYLSNRAPVIVHHMAEQREEVA